MDRWLWVINAKNLNFQKLLSDFKKTQNKTSLYHSKTKYEIIFQENRSIYLSQMIKGKYKIFTFEYKFLSFKSAGIYWNSPAILL